MRFVCQLGVSGDPDATVLDRLAELPDSSYATVVASPDVLNTFDQSDTSDGLLVQSLLGEIWRLLHPMGSAWLYYGIDRNSDVFSEPFSVCDIAAQAQFALRNIIKHLDVTLPQTSPLQNAVSWLLFLVKDRSNYFFDKTSLREPHMWRDVEWGGGRRNVYHPDGKDPGNVWIRGTRYDGSDAPPDYETYDYEDRIGAIVSAASEQQDKVLLLVTEGTKLKPIRRPQRTLHHIRIKERVAKSEWTPPLGAHEGRPTTGTLREGTINGSSEEMAEIPSNSIQTIVTSPPYWRMKDYGSEEQIGWKETYEIYQKRLSAVWSECFRVLRESGSLWINVNTQMNNGSLLLLPHHIIENLKTIGFHYQDTVVWYKTSSRAGLHPSNVVDNSEYIIWCSKSPSPFVDLSQTFADFPPSMETLPLSIWKMSRNSGSISRLTRLLGNGKLPKHEAIYPVELPERAIRLTSKEGDWVLDPFMGSGTTAVAAQRLNRMWVGYEINPVFNKLVQMRLKEPS